MICVGRRAGTFPQNENRVVWDTGEMASEVSAGQTGLDKVCYGGSGLAPEVSGAGSSMRGARRLKSRQRRTSDYTFQEQQG